MLRDEQTITMTYADFQKVIQDEVKKHMTSVSPSYIFPSSSNIKKSIREINDSNKELKKMRTEERIGRAKFDRYEIDGKLYYNDDIIGEKPTFSPDKHIHNSVRSLALAVYGLTLNRDVENDVQAFHLQRYYNGFVDMFLEFYKERIEREYPE